jgi:hypothetical protein
MSDRRAFLTTVTGSLAGFLVPAIVPRTPSGALAVTAEPTLFWANPSGRANLVRFLVTGTSAPAGRLRVYDRSRRLLGTAGLLRVEGALRGELWIDLERPVTVTSELEAPGLGRVLRTSHRLVPTPRWTIVWLTAADPTALRAQLENLTPLERAVREAIWREAGVIANPLAAAGRLHVLDHLEFLRLGAVGGALADSLGIPLATAALADAVEALPTTTPLALAGAGVPLLVRRFGMEPFAWWPSPDGSRLLAATLPAGADPGALGFSAGPDEMADRIDLHLRSSAVAASLQRDAAGDPLTFVLQTAVTDEIPAMVVSVREWNRRFAHPRIVLGGADDLARVSAHVPPALPTIASTESSEVALPDPAMLVQVAQARRDEGHHRLQHALAPFAALMTGQSADVDAARAIAAAIDTRVGGYMVVNPSPFRRTDAVTLPDGRMQLVTDVPGYGYTFVLDDGVTPLTRAYDRGEDLPAIDSGGLSVEIESRTGAIGSLRRLGHWRQWVARAGANGAAGAALEGIELQRFPGIGTRVVLARRAPGVGTFSSTILACDALPWIDIENRAGPEGQTPHIWTFDFAIDEPALRWEIPAGHTQGQPPLRYLAHLRWLALDAPDGSVLFRGSETPYVAVEPDARLEAPAADGPTRYRLQLTWETPSVVECTEFGWNTEPLVVLPVSGRNAGRAPRFGTPFVLDQDDAAIIGIDRGPAGDSVTVYIQNLTPVPRLLTLGFGLLAWSDARRVDFRGRETADALMPVPDGIAVEAPPWGVVAVWLSGLRIRFSG